MIEYIDYIDEEMENILEDYQVYFSNIWEKDEKYKWIAVKHFQEHWNIDADDFASMFDKATEKTKNLLSSMNFFPRKLILKFAEENPNRVREMFRTLYNDEIDLIDRVKNFENESAELFDIVKQDGNKNHFQTPNAISTYLWLRFPDKYTIYKSSLLDTLIKHLVINVEAKEKYDKMLLSFELYDKISEYIKNNSAVVNMFRKACTDDCYRDSELKTLAIDVAYFIDKVYYAEEGVNSEMSNKDHYELIQEIWNRKTNYSDIKSHYTNDWYQLRPDNWKNFAKPSDKGIHYEFKINKNSSIEIRFDNEIKNKDSFSDSRKKIKDFMEKLNGTTLKINDEKSVKLKFEESKSLVLKVDETISIDKKEEAVEIMSKLIEFTKEKVDSLGLHGTSNTNQKLGESIMSNVHSKNTILYGPPGTGKTYSTAIYAVSICDPKFDCSDYNKVVERYNELKAVGRIAFTTFHQSYGYEEFIEGIKPVLDGQAADVQYELTDGIFKTFCSTATKPQSSDNSDIDDNAAIWKISLEGAGDNPTRTECMKNDHIRVGWDEYGDKFDFNEIGSGKNELNAFINRMKIGDLVFSCYSKNEIDAIGVITGEYEWDGSYDYYNRVRKVKWLVKGIKHDITSINSGKIMTLSTVYKLKIQLSDAFKIIEKYTDATSTVVPNDKNYVFIIDEINRGNISKIFGELITLIEESKRDGMAEKASVILPYSKTPFSVPSNVYILGTMNTADRSIALMDTALRRRFNFIEMMPDATVLDGIIVDGIDIPKMLNTINERIEYLYDREHTIGHAFFTSLKSEPKLNNLAIIFKDKIIPLLQEYFYEDYQKIQLVLGDDDKDSSLKFIKDEKINKKLFKSNIDDIMDSDSKKYTINASAFNNADAYKKIYE